MDEIWISHYTPKTSRWSAEWTVAGDAFQSGLKRISQLTKLWRSYFGIGIEFGPLTALKYIRQSVATVTWSS